MPSSGKEIVMTITSQPDRANERLWCQSQSRWPGLRATPELSDPLRNACVTSQISAVIFGPMMMRISLDTLRWSRVVLAGIACCVLHSTALSIMCFNECPLSRGAEGRWTKANNALETFRPSSPTGRAWDKPGEQ
jgi:hypothetical protein